MKSKGSMQDTWLFIVLSIILIVLALTYVSISVPITQACNSTITSLGVSGNSNFSNLCPQIQNASGNFATIIPLCIIALGISIVVASAFVRTSPLFFLVGVLLALTGVVFAVNVQAIMPSIFQNTFFTSAVSQYPLLAAIGNNFATIFVVFVMLVLIVLYSINRKGGLPDQ